MCSCLHIHTFWWLCTRKIAHSSPFSPIMSLQLRSWDNLWVFFTGLFQVIEAKFQHQMVLHGFLICLVQAHIHWKQPLLSNTLKLVNDSTSQPPVSVYFSFESFWAQSCDSRRPVLNVPDVFQPCLSLAGPSHSWTVLCKCFWTEFAFLSLRQRRVGLFEKSNRDYYERYASTNSRTARSHWRLRDR